MATPEQKERAFQSYKAHVLYQAKVNAWPLPTNAWPLPTEEEIRQAWERCCVGALARSAKVLLRVRRARVQELAEGEKHLPEAPAGWSRPIPSSEMVALRRVLAATQEELARRGKAELLQAGKGGRGQKTESLGSVPLP